MRTKDEVIAGLPMAWRIEEIDVGFEHALVMRAFRVWPNLVPDLIRLSPDTWESLHDDDKPRIVVIQTTEVDFPPDKFTFAAFWGFSPTTYNLFRIASGYRNRIGFDQWGIKVMWAHEALANLLTGASILVGAWNH